MRHCILKLFIKIKKSKTQPTINSNMEYRKSQQGTVSKEIEKIAYIYIYIYPYPLLIRDFLIFCL